MVSPEDDFRTTVRHEEQVTSDYLGVEVKLVATGSEIKPSRKTFKQLNYWMDKRKEANAHLRDLTGEEDDASALRAANQMIKAFQSESTVVEDIQVLNNNPPDDRDPSVSVPTCPGGLPSLGKNN